MNRAYPPYRVRVRLQPSPVEGEGTKGTALYLDKGNLAELRAGFRRRTKESWQYASVGAGSQPAPTTVDGEGIDNPHPSPLP